MTEKRLNRKGEKVEIPKDAPKGAFARGPRNLPEASKRKRIRKNAKIARRITRQAYNGQ